MFTFYLIILIDRADGQPNFDILPKGLKMLYSGEIQNLAKLCHLCFKPLYNSPWRRNVSMWNEFLLRLFNGDVEDDIEDGIEDDILAKIRDVWRVS